MGEVAIKFSGEALQTVETIRGNRNEPIEQTLGRALSIAAVVATECAKGATVLFQELDGTMKSLAC